MTRALITGVFGQDGSYLAELLSANGYEVHGVARADLSSHGRALRAHLAGKGVVPVLHDCDLEDAAAVGALVAAVEPDECYHLAAIHYSSEVLPAQQAELDRALFQQNVLSTLNLLSAIRQHSPRTRVVLAGSCLMYDASASSPQNESMPYRSRSLYGLSKIAGCNLVDYFRAEHGLHASTAVLYNHESPRRRSAFVTRKIVQGLVAVRRGRSEQLGLGNLDTVKDWGYAPDYVEGLWRMARSDCPASYLLATGVPHTVEDFVREAADTLGYQDFREVVRVESGLARGQGSVTLVGDPTRARTQLGWRSTVTFREMIERMMEHELAGTLD
jgi:GDPmannose 4,6-dehydratase